MVRIETTDGDSFLGWVTSSSPTHLSLQLAGDDRDGWLLSVPWPSVATLQDVTEFMTRKLATEVWPMSPEKAAQNNTSAQRPLFDREKACPTCNSRRA